MAYRKRYSSRRRSGRAGGSFKRRSGSKRFTSYRVSRGGIRL